MQDHKRLQCSKVLGAMVFTGIIIAGTASLTIAHQGAKGVVKERMDLMSSVAKQLKSAVLMMRGKKPFNADTLSKSAGTIAGHARQIPKLFPKGSGAHPSEATPNVWQKWDEFVSQSKEMELAAEALSTKAGQAKSFSELLPEFKALAATCGGCHGKFRIKK